MVGDLYAVLAAAAEAALSAAGRLGGATALGVSALGRFTWLLGSGFAVSAITTGATLAAATATTGTGLARRATGKLHIAPAAAATGVLEGPAGVEVGRAIVFVFETRQSELRDARTDEAFNIVHVATFVGSREHVGIADGHGSAGASDAVNVVLGVLRDIVVDHVRHA